jgi:hypothetical protein
LEIFCARTCSAKPSVARTCHRGAAGALFADSDDAVHLLRFEAVHLADVMPSSVVPISGSVSAWSFR